MARRRRAAAAWFASEEQDWPFSFVNACAAVGELTDLDRRDLRHGAGGAGMIRSYALITIAVAVAVIMLRQPLLSPLQEGRRLIDALARATINGKTPPDMELIVIPFGTIIPSARRGATSASPPT